ncbi:O-antigen ligase family protein [Paenibacillus sp. WLX1005]|uniref:O-antigen ligase family protein n=1 Tax=unclassified Paenibacillus TaxID=185978 RepID=UPI0039841272
MMSTPSTLSDSSDITVKSKFLTFVAVMLIVVTSGSVLFGKQFYAECIMVLFAIALVFFFPKKIEPRQFLILMAVMIVILFNMLIYRTNIGGYAGLMLKIMAVFMVLNRIDLRQAAKSYQWLITALAILGMPFYLFGVLDAALVREVFPPTAVWGGAYRITPFHVYGLWNMSRNQGIFWEPGAYQVFLNLGILLTLFLNKKVPKWRLIILTATLLTTMSTSGYMICGLIFLAYVIRNGKREQMAQMLLSLLLFIPLVFFIAQSGVVTDKFQDGNASFDRRSLDTSSNLELMVEKPLFGWGFQNNAVLMERYGIPDSSNSLLTFGYQFGLPLLLILMIYYYFQILRPVGGVFQALLIFIGLLVVFSTENMLFQPLFITLMFLDTSRIQAAVQAERGEIRGNEVSRIRGPLRQQRVTAEKGI